MIIEIKNVEGLNIPTRANEGDAGYDIVATSDPRIVGEIVTVNGSDEVLYKNIDFIEYKTNVFISPQSDVVTKGLNENIYTYIKTKYHTYAMPRSSLSKYNLSVANSLGIIDQIYVGELLFRFNYVYQPEDYRIFDNGKICNHRLLAKVNINKIYKKGDRIGQLLVTETIDATFKIVDELKDTTRGTGGFGNSGN